jgi:hypothetical protein
VKDSGPRKIIDIWPVIQEDFKTFMSDRPGWLITTLENARKRRGNRGWQEIERVINILRFLKDTEIEYY